jgi:hypothetical protein
MADLGRERTDALGSYAAVVAQPDLAVPTCCRPSGRGAARVASNLNAGFAMATKPPVR